MSYNLNGTQGTIGKSYGGASFVGTGGSCPDTGARATTETTTCSLTSETSARSATRWVQSETTATLKVAVAAEL